VSVFKIYPEYIEMRSLIFTRSLVAVCLASGLAACGGGGDSSPAVSTVPAIDAAAVSTLNSSFNSGLVALTTYAGLQNTALFDLFAATFLDAGSTKAMVQSNLSQDAIALAHDFLSGFGLFQRRGQQLQCQQCVHPYGHLDQ
jgi:hypothetical protein